MAVEPSKYNLKSPGVKRLMREAMELAEPTEEYFAAPLDDNLFEWHFTVRGPPNTEFEGGFYHGRILLPTQYPMQPPNIILLTPNGRFEVNKKICLSISGHHPESWQPSWSIRTALLALIAFMPTAAAGTIGSLDYTPDERKVLAKKSVNWKCDICGSVCNKLIDISNATARATLTSEESTLIQQIALKAEEETNRNDKEKQATEPEIENQDSVRQRTNVTQENVHERIVRETENVVAGVFMDTSIERNNKDKIWSAVIWTLISMITLLIIRRCFFL